MLAAIPMEVRSIVEAQENTRFDRCHFLVYGDTGLQFELVLVGDGPMRGPIERLIDAQGLGDHVRLAGWLSSAQVRDAIKNLKPTE